MPEDIEDIHDVKEYLYRIDENTKNIYRKMERHDERLAQVENKADKNQTRITRMSVYIGGIASFIGALVGLMLSKIGELL